MFLKELVEKNTFDKDGYVLLDTSLTNDFDFDNLINEITSSRSKWFYYPNISDEFCYNEVKINKIIYYPFITELNITVQIKFFNINSSLPTIHKIDYIYYSDEILYNIIYFIVPLLLCYLYQFL